MILKEGLQMRNWKKLVACAVIISVTLSSFTVAGCGRKPRSNPKIEADSDWYNLDKVTLGSDIDLSGTQYSQTKVLGRVGDCYALWHRGTYPIPYDVDCDNIDIREYSLMQLDSYDLSGGHLHSVDYIDAVSSSGLLDEAAALMSSDDEDDLISGDDLMFDIWDPEIRDDKVAVGVEVYGGPDSDALGYELYIDPATGEVTYERLEGAAHVLPPGAEGTVLMSKFGEYQINEYMAHDDDGLAYTIIGVTDSDRNVTVFDLAQQLEEYSMVAIKGYLGMGSGKILCISLGEELFGPDDYYVLDVASESITKVTDDRYSWLESVDYRSVSYFEGIGNVIMDNYGIKVIDFENSTVSESMSFDCCNINRSDVPYMDLISYTEDEIVLIGSGYMISDQDDSGDDQVMIRLTRADSNPNAGKTILTAAATGSINYAMSEAVCSFNETGSDYFITFDPKYTIDQYMTSDPMADMTENDSAIQTDNAYSQLSDQLAVDLMAGEGPDIIFDSFSLSQLNDDAYLTDMSEWIDTGGMFGNIVEACKKDGKLYQMPLAFGVTGIVTGTENVAPGQNGFTFDEYTDFVSTVCNGQDPLAMNQTEFFIQCLATMDDLCYTEDGKISYDNDAFRALADFTSENIFPVYDQTYEDVMSLDNAGGIYFRKGSFISLIASLRARMNDVSILGLPSIDGRGPLASVECSVAVSAQSPEQDGCRSFVETLLSQPIQEYYAYDTNYSPISVAAFDSIAVKIIDDFNEDMAVYETISSPAELAMNGIDTTRIDTGVIDAYKEMIGTICSVETSDVARDIIIREEIPAYFVHQKNLEEVIPVIENRVQTMLDERG